MSKYHIRKDGRVIPGLRKQRSRPIARAPARKRRSSAPPTSSAFCGSGVGSASRVASSTLIRRSLGSGSRAPIVRNRASIVCSSRCARGANLPRRSCGRHRESQRERHAKRIELAARHSRARSAAARLEPRTTSQRAGSLLRSLVQGSRRAPSSSARKTRGETKEPEAAPGNGSRGLLLRFLRTRRPTRDSR